MTFLLLKKKPEFREHILHMQGVIYIYIILANSVGEKELCNLKVYFNLKDY